MQLSQNYNVSFIFYFEMTRVRCVSSYRLVFEHHLHGIYCVSLILRNISANNCNFDLKPILFTLQ